ncbi:MAG TPA: response regulator transcription factor [Dehalococcoidia bacterium]|nr:response regulator transcription factor [Dehalococcoidia bacterium]
MTIADTVQGARAAFEGRDWEEAYDLLAPLARERSLTLDDLERFAVAAHMTGREPESCSAWENAHEESLRHGDVQRAARCTFWLGLLSSLAGEMTLASGWLSRGKRLLDEGGLDCVERGYLMLPPAVWLLNQRDFSGARERCDEIIALARRFGDRQLETMAALGRAQGLIGEGHVESGFELLDEIMVSIGVTPLSPVLNGFVYCVAIDCCQATLDLPRARVWTSSLGRWCDSQRGLVPFHRECLVHRSTILRLQGLWLDAMREAQRAGALTTREADAGPALYEQGEILRLRGEFAMAEEAFRQASRFGHHVQPGMALLRLGQGQVEAAAAAIRVAAAEALSPLDRWRILPAFVEVMLAAGDLEAARAGAAELAELAAARPGALLRAAARTATGATRLATGEAAAALSELRRAFAEWQAIEAPYEAARTRVIIAMACRELGDHDGAELELDAARWLFQKLGAAPDLARVETLLPKAATRPAGGLTERELEVLRLVASGQTNSAIAAELVLSEHTVRRHIQNIFAKLGVSSRSAATAFAFQHGLA